MRGQQGVDAAGDLLARACEALGQLQEQAVALVLLVLQVKGEGQAVLQFGAKVAHVPVVHGGEPAPEVRDEGFGLGVRGFQRGEQEAQPFPQGVARLVHTRQHVAQPHRKARLGLAQGAGKLGPPRGVLCAGHAGGTGRFGCAGCVGRSRFRGRSGLGLGPGFRGSGRGLGRVRLAGRPQFLDGAEETHMSSSGCGGSGGGERRRGPEPCRSQGRHNFAQNPRRVKVTGAGAARTGRAARISVAPRRRRSFHRMAHRVRCRKPEAPRAARCFETGDGDMTPA